MSADLDALTVLAHSGHWLVQLIYFGPVIAFALWLAVRIVRERMRGEEDEPS